jgi:hypothetical protein
MTRIAQSLQIAHSVVFSFAIRNNVINLQGTTKKPPVLCVRSSALATAVFVSPTHSFLQRIPFCTTPPNFAAFPQVMKRANATSHWVMFLVPS